MCKCIASRSRRCWHRAHLLLAVHCLVLLQRRVLALRVAAQLQHLALARQPPLPELPLLGLHAALHRRALLLHAANVGVELRTHRLHAALQQGW